MTPTEARTRIMELASQVAANPASAEQVAAEMKELGQVILSTPGTGGTFEPPILGSMCVAHDQVCKGHQVCKAHPKKLS